MKKYAIMLAALLMTLSAAADKKNSNNDMDKDIKVELKTTMGDVTVLLYNDTPLHRDNFVKLVNEGYYDGVLFHRVIKDFMVQTGDGNSRDAKPGEMLGSGDPGYTIPAEIHYPKHFHKAGALAAARTGDQVNPERRSSGSQFYIVTGEVVKDADLKRFEQRMTQQLRQQYLNQLIQDNKPRFAELREAADSDGMMDLRRKLVIQAQDDVKPYQFPEEVRKAYTTIGGSPHLDAQYTVFGEVIKGMDVVKSIQDVKTDRNDRPVEDVRVISAKVVVD